MTDSLKRNIEEAKQMLVQIKNQQRLALSQQKQPVEVQSFPVYALSIEVEKFFKGVKDEVLREINLYTPIQEPEIKLSEVNLMPTDAEEENALNTSPIHNYAEAFKNDIKIASILDYDISHLENIEQENFTFSELNLYKVVCAELDYARKNMAALGCPANIIHKMETAVTSIGLKRINDAVTVLKTAQKNSPNNRSLAFMLSQIYYFRAQNGGAESLPEARAEAKRSCLYSEGCDEVQLRQYRYTYVVSEARHDPEKAVRLLRDYYLLNPEGLTQSHGFAVHEGVHLKAWVLLSTLSPKLLTSFELESLLTIVNSTLGGVNFYLSMMRPQILKRLEDEKDNTAQSFIKVEEMLCRSQQKYNEILNIIRQNYNNGYMVGGSQNLWTIENKYIALLLKTAPLPKFDEIYLYASLDAKKHNADAYPNLLMPTIGLANVNYWQAWSLAITAVEGKAGGRTLPLKKQMMQMELFKKFDDICNELSEFEQTFLPQENWEKVEKYMPSYDYKTFVHVAAGVGAFPVPDNPYYLKLYRQWVTQSPYGVLASSILKIQAENGHFIDADEVIAAFEGALRVITDDVHGLEARVKAAIKQYTKAQKKESVDEPLDENLTPSHFNDYWWLYVIALPLAILAFFIMYSSGGSITGVGILVAIMLVAVTLGYIFYSSGNEELAEENEEAIVKDPTSNE